MADLYVFGDSIGYGAWDEKGGWADRLKQYFHSKKLEEPNKGTSEVYNLSVDGDASGDVAKRIKSELQSRRKPWSTLDDVVLVAIGTNDAYAVDEPSNFPVSPDDYLENLKSILKDVQSVGLRIAFMSLDPVDESQTNPCPWGAYYWTNDRISLLNGVLEKFCTDNKLPLLNLYDRLLAEPDFESMLFDGAHPNTIGHEYMYENVKPFVAGLLEK